MTTPATEGPARFAIWLGLALIVLGGLSLLAVTYSPLLLFGTIGVVGLVAGGTALARVRIYGRAGWWERNVGTVVVALVPIALLLFAAMTGVEHEVVHEMTWEVGPPVPHQSKQKRVILHFTRYPGYYIEMYSDELLSYLESQPTRKTHVTFVVTTDFGRMRGFREVAIGDRAVDPSWAGGYGAVNYSGPSPFHEWE